MAEWLRSYKAEDAIAANEAAGRDAYVVEKLAEMDFMPTQLVQGQQRIELNDAARRLLALHMCDPILRDEVWGMASVPHKSSRSKSASARLPADELAEILQNPRAASFGDLNKNEDMLPAKFWPYFFEFLQLPRWYVRQGDEDAGVPGRILLVKQTYLLRSERGDRLSPNTAAIVRFYEHLKRQFDYADTEILRDLVLLYFISTCLLKKNGREVLEQSRHVAPRLREKQALKQNEYQRLVELYDQQARTGLVRITRPDKPLPPDNELDVMYRALELLSARICDPPAGPARYVEISDTRQAWGNLAAMLGSDQPPRYTLPKQPAVQETEGGAGPAAEETSALTTSVTPEDVEEEAKKAEADVPPNLPVRGTPEQEASPPGPPTPPREPINKRMGCAYHAALESRTPLAIDAPRLCTAQCIQRQIGSPIAAQSAATPSRAVQRIASQLSAAPEQATMALVITSMTPQTPRARQLILRRAGIAQQVGAVKSNSDWADMIRPLCKIDTDSTAHLQKIDELASACGWLGRPIGDRIARYATVYGAPDHRDAFVQLRWPRTAAIDAKIEQFKDANPAVPLRTLQLVASIFKN